MLDQAIWGVYVAGWEAVWWGWRALPPLQFVAQVGLVDKCVCVGKLSISGMLSPS